MPMLGGREIPPAYLAGGVVILAGGYFLWRSRRSSAAPAAKAPTAAAMPTPVVPAGSYGAGQNAGALQNISTQLQNLQASQAATAGSAAKAGGLTATVENSELSGSGYRPNPSNPQGAKTVVAGNNGRRYQQAEVATLYSLLGTNTPTYYQPLPGVFQQFTDYNKIAPNTPVFLQVG